MSVSDHRFTAMTCEMRIVGAADPLALEQEVHAFAACLTRFDERSELSRLNADERTIVPASFRLCRAVAAALHAAELTHGLVDPTLAADMEKAGYDATIQVPADLREALLVAPPRRAASGRDLWRQVRVLAGAIVRPPGLRLDLNGTAKGLLADLLIDRAVAVDCAGDLRVRSDVPLDVEVVHPLSGEPAAILRLTDGAVATSGLDRRIWHEPGDRFGHHLLDPSTGRPAWTGLIGATALAPTGLEAEARAKATLLSGPERGRPWLAAHGGLLFHDDGTVEQA